MDTDDLTEMGYECIGLAGEASDCLRAEIGSTCSKYRNEDDFLRGVLARVKTIQAAPQRYLDEWELLEDEDGDFSAKLRPLRKHIERTLATPIEKRGNPAF